MIPDREKQTDQSKTKDSFFFLSTSDNALVLLVDLDTT